jgi:hypothetical protein
MQITLFLLMSFIHCANAAQIGLVIAPKAIVYADQQLTTPIGYIKNGKKVKVGEVKRQKGTVLPIIISGRVAFIKTMDIALQEIKGIEHKGHRVSEHDIEENFKRDSDKLNENNFLFVSLSNQSLGSNWQEVNETAGSEVPTAMATSIIFQHRPLFKRLSWGFGGTYYTAASSNVELKTVTLDGKFYYDFLRYKYFSIQGYFGILATGDIQVETKFADGSDSLSRGTGYGYNFGAQARIFPHQQWGVSIGAGISTINTSLNDVAIPEDSTQGDLSSVGGVSLFAGISYAL